MTPRDHRPWAQSPWRHQNYSHEPHEGEGAAVVDVSDPPLHIAEAGGILFSAAVLLYFGFLMMAQGTKTMNEFDLILHFLLAVDLEKI